VWPKRVNEAFPFYFSFLIDFGHTNCIGVIERVFGLDVRTVDHVRLSRAGEQATIKFNRGFKGVFLAAVDNVNRQRFLPLVQRLQPTITTARESLIVLKGIERNTAACAAVGLERM
jgi:hypothetical protein